MKKLLLASSALIAISGPAFAIAPAPAPFSWTGFYIGANVGAGWDRTKVSDPGNLGLNFFDMPAIIQNIAPLGSSIGINGGAGAMGGFQGGYNYQFSNHWIVGVRGDFSWTDINGFGKDPFFDGKFGDAIRMHSRTDFLATVTGRAGYGWDRYMLYVNGGAAWAHNSYSIQNLVSVNWVNCGFSSGCNIDGSTNRVGWTAGVGFEYKLSSNWSTMAEYNHFDFGDKGVWFTGTPANTAAVFNIKQTMDTVRVGINYRFGTPGSNVAYH